MEQLSLFVAQEECQKYVFKLKMALYVLKQSSRAWFGKFSEIFLEFGLWMCQTNHSVFHLQTDACFFILIVYVDDIVITSDDVGKSAQLKQFLQKKIQTKDLCKLRYFLGIKITIIT